MNNIPAYAYVAMRATDASKLTERILMGAKGVLPISFTSKTFMPSDELITISELGYCEVIFDHNTPAKLYTVKAKDSGRMVEFSDFMEVLAYIMRHWW